MRKGDIVVKILEGAGVRTASFHRVKAVNKKGTAFLGDGRGEDDVEAYDAATGNARASYITGFRSYLVELDGGEDRALLKNQIS